MGFSPRKSNNQRAQEERARKGEKQPKKMNPQQKRLRKRKRKRKK